MKYYNEYLAKLKNKESFVNKGAQTISKFKSSDVVSTSFNKDTEGTMEDKKINCLNYVISDSYIGKKSKIEDQFIQTQKMLEKKVRKELKQTENRRSIYPNTKNARKKSQERIKANFETY